MTNSQRTSLVTALVAERLGADRVETDPAALIKLSSDWSRMSPVLLEKVPSGRYVADAIVRPRTEQEVADVLALAYEHDVPVVPRGAGTGNYGQATPFTGGIILDLRGLDSIEVLADGDVRAGAGARMTRIDKVAREAGRDLWIFPSTKGSTIGGFIGGGSAGTGTIEHGTTSDGFVTELTVAPMDGSGRLITVRGEETLPYIHAYGVTGVVTSVVVRTDPARDWVAVYAAFDSWDAMVAVHRRLLDLPVLPRLASGDEPALVPTLTTNVELDPAQHSLRVIAEASTVADIESLVATAGGSVRALLEDYAATDLLSGMSYNHPVYFLQRAHRDRSWFHMETGGELYWSDADRVREVYDGPVWLHLELMGRGPLAMVVAEYASEEQVLAGIPRFDEIGVGVHSPHQWYVDRNVELVTAVARERDPKGLLNQGKLTDHSLVDTRVNIGVR